MKKFFIALAILLVLMQFSIAVEIKMNSNFSTGETLLAEISGNFIDALSKENINFYRGHIEIPIEYKLTEINGKYYLYAMLIGKSQGNYSLVLEKIKYLKAGQQSTEDIIKNFSIESSTADFSVEPGFIKTTNDFSVKVQNLQDFDIEIKYALKSENETQGAKTFLESLFSSGGPIEEKSIILSSGEIREIQFNIKEMNQSSFKILQLSSGNINYFIPIYNPSPRQEEENNEKSFIFEPSKINFSLSTNSNTTRTIYLYNDGEQDLKDISLSLSADLEDYVLLSKENINLLKINSSEKIIMTFFSGSKEKNLTGDLIALEKNSSLETTLSVSINLLKDYILAGTEEQVVEDPAERNRIKTCAEMNGTICPLEEYCLNSTQISSNGNCCLTSCKKEEKSKASKIVGWILIGLVVLVVLWFFKSKYSKTKKNVNLLEVAKGKK